MSLMRVFLAAFALLLIGCGATTPAGGGASNGNITISDAWVRPSTGGGMAMDHGGDHSGMAMPTAEGGMAMPTTEGGMATMDYGNTAAYMVIRSSAEDKLVSVASDVAKSVELHTVLNEGGVMSMRPVEGGIGIGGNSSVTMEPGGYHVMMIGLNKELKAGDTVRLQLQFEKAGTVQLDAVVREPAN